VTHQYLINFNKGQDQVSRIERQMELGRWLTLLVFVLIMGGISWYSYTYLENLQGMIDGKENQLVQVKKDIKRLRKTGTQLSRDDIFRLNRLQEGRISWSQKVLGLGQEVSKRMAITGAKYEKGRLLIDGIVKIEETREPVFDVMEFVDNLEHNPYFKDNFASIKFGSTERTRIQDEEVLEFQVVCQVHDSYKATAFEKSVERAGTGRK